jgi:hypothetical protein
MVNLMRIMLVVAGLALSFGAAHAFDLGEQLKKAIEQGTQTSGKLGAEKSDSPLNLLAGLSQ